ncbi:oligomeric, coiled-coil, peripheral membrane protein, variant 3 [Cadophora gregata]|uniref:oligomeric, coiled-coil, peripheral membrane protein, variant 3 n=2 Tax=Cadophora gregata TaxID=51156 RepID=UPI0026DD2E5E|nr:oligomeric, coiled-coil, peripheral membrane protein, variant 3 [Cadophora gregata]KAK0104626.1 oligomeric, coiled-coil, peripheral membrane protein, variant 3 [Cadophora gregata]KAK0115287.1 oligomeric, coiled-coil, peripheral membrane protein, variant 2 [Cadophora gregata f. sp. sojae]
MALLILLAHTGEVLEVDSGTFASLDAFKIWVSKQSQVAIQDQITLTSSGKPVKFQGLSTEKEIFVYDRRIVQPSSPGSSKSLQSELALPPKYNVSRPPDTIADQNDLQAWRDLFMQRRSWALKLVDDCSSMSQEAQKRFEEVEVIHRGVEAAVMNLDKHVKALDQKNADIQTWAAEVQKEQDLAGPDWIDSLSRLRSIPVTTEMIKFITGHDPRRNQKRHTLVDLVDTDEIKSAGKLVRNVASRLAKNSEDLSARVNEVFSKADDMYANVEQGVQKALVGRAAEPAQLMEDIEAIAKKVSNDYENVSGYSNTPKNVSLASKSALLHTKNFLPNLSKRCLEMDGILFNATEARNLIAAESLSAMREIATLTSMVAEANAAFAAMDLEEEAYDACHLLSVVNSLPVSYASFLAEAIRRKEWSDKVRSDSSTLANEMASFQDEEVKRRRKWQKITGTAFWGDKTERDVVGLEVKLLGTEDQWPHVGRQDLEEVLEMLQSQDAKSSVVADVTRIIAELDNPTKQQSKRAKAFKAGSIHEAALGRSTLLTRGDDDLIRVLQEDKQRTENRLKTAESRVRRLEDLLHRQSQMTRPSNGNIFPPSGNPSPDLQNVINPLASPRLVDDLSRRSSVSSRRFSANQGPDEKAFQQKLLSLEAELIAERERADGLEREVTARKTGADDMKSQVEEANSLKKDLMENFDAQQREFIEERMSLESEIRRLKAKLEELEDEMDRYLGSRENERTSIDDRVRSLQDELEKARKEAIAESQKAQGQVDFLRDEAKMQRETNDSLEKQLQKLRQENRGLITRAEKAEAEVELQVKTLGDVHSHLSPTSAVPGDLGVLASTLVTLSGDLVAELYSVKSDAAILRSDRDVAQADLAEIKLKMESVNAKLSTEQTEALHLRERLAEERAKFTALEAELNDERLQLSTLRTKISDGETGSEALRTRLEEEERKVTSMSEDLAARQSRLGGLEEELRSVQEKYHFAQEKHETLTTRFEARGSRAKDLTHRVYSQNDRLCRLLERLSYSVTREGDSMIIQRVPRLDRSNANDSSDPGSTIRRSISGAITRKSMADSGDLDLLYWMNSDDPEAESGKYEAFMHAIGNFDVEAFCEVITKRVKDMEYTAKKYSKDARAYRDKSHAAQKEAHEKIAFKNFKEGDLALFLPTRNQTTGAWAAFNIGAPHFFLKEQESHKLRTRDWLLARIHKIEDRVVDLSKSMSGTHLQPSDRRSLTSNGGDSFEDDNPFDLSDGLRWYLIEASEEKPGAPSTPGLGKSTVASTHVDATGSIRRSKKSSSSGMDGINKTLSKSLDSRRSSNNSKKSVPLATTLDRTGSTATDTASLKAPATTQTANEGSEAQMIRPSSRHDGNGSGDKGLINPENITKSNVTSTGTSPAKKSMIWDSLWSLDLSLESGKNKK